MGQSLLFLPDISGYTQFVQNTEIEHSQHVISELLDLLADANTLGMQLAEVEGDALFFYKEGLPSQEKILAQVEHLFTAFYSHLRLLEKNRICPCNACLTAPNLQLKIVAHAGELQFINVQNNKKPFGAQVIEVHRLLKNSVESNNYVLFSIDLADAIRMQHEYSSRLFNFTKSEDVYDGNTVEYIYSDIDNSKLTLSPFEQSKRVELEGKPDLRVSVKFNISAENLLEYITNYGYRHHWVKGVDEFKYNENEVTRIDSPHVCVINGKSLDFVVVVKDAKPHQLVYGELTTSPGIIDELYQFFIITPISEKECELVSETYFRVQSFVKRLLVKFVVAKVFEKNNLNNLKNLSEFINNKQLSGLSHS